MQSMAGFLDAGSGLDGGAETAIWMAPRIRWLIKDAR